MSVAGDAAVDAGPRCLPCDPTGTWSVAAAGCFGAHSLNLTLSDSWAGGRWLVEASGGPATVCAGGARKGSITWSDDCQVEVKFGSGCFAGGEDNGDEYVASFLACGTEAEIRYGELWCTSNPPNLVFTTQKVPITRVR